jgi:hypothetical protein
VKRAVKIKAYLFLLAWIIIFAHGLIPHDHAEDLCNGGRGISTECDHHGSQSHSSAIAFNQPDNDKVCHLVNILFQNFSADNFLPFSAQETVSVPEGNPGKIYIHFSHSLIDQHCRSYLAFRAPPVA